MSEVHATKIPSWADAGAFSSSVDLATIKAIEVGLLRAVDAPAHVLAREGQILHLILMTLPEILRGEVHRRYMAAVPTIMQPGRIVRLP